MTRRQQAEICGWSRIAGKPECICTDAQLKDLNSGRRVRPALGWLVGCPVVLGQIWVPTLWDGEDDPTFTKAACIQAAKE